MHAHDDDPIFQAKCLALSVDEVRQGPGPRHFERTPAWYEARDEKRRQLALKFAERRARRAEQALVALALRPHSSNGHADASSVPLEPAAASVPSHPDSMLSAREAALVLNCNERTVRNRCRDGAIPFTRLKDSPVGEIRIRRGDLSAFTRPATLPRSQMRKIIADVRAEN